MLVFSALAPSAAAGGNPTSFDGNPSCGDLGFAGLKIDDQPTNNTTYTASNSDTEGQVPAGLEITITGLVHDDVNKTVTFTWTATVPDGDDAGTERDPFFIDVVLVKYANGGLRWDYAQPGASSDTVFADNDDISHVSFCFDGGGGGTTTTTTSGATTGEVLGTTAGGADTGDAEVQGNTVTRAAPQSLPVTGDNDTSLAIAGLVLVALGGTSLFLRSRMGRRTGAHFA